MVRRRAAITAPCRRPGPTGRVTSAGPPSGWSVRRARRSWRAWSAGRARFGPWARVTRSPTSPARTACSWTSPGCGGCSAVDGADVTVEAGITLHDLGEELAARGLALENQGDVDSQTLAGADRTATHGTGGRFRNLSSQVVGMRIVDGAGDVVDVREEDELRAARVSLGALGVIAAVTVRCVPAFRIHRVTSRARSTRCCRASTSSWTASTTSRPSCSPTRAPRSRSPPSAPTAAPRPRSRLEATFQDVVVENVVLGAAFRTGRLRPSLIPAINRLLARLMSRDERLDASNRVYANERRVRFTEMEYAIPRERAAEARRARAGADRATAAAGGVPDRAARGGARRRLSVDRLRPRRPHTSPCTSTAGWSSRPTSAPSSGSWTSTVGAPTGASATTNPPTRSLRATRTGSASSPCGGASTPRAASRTTTPTACSGRSRLRLAADARQPVVQGHDPAVDRRHARA